MSAISSKVAFTPEDLLRLPDSINYELVDGQLVERNMGLESSLIVAQMIRLLKNFVDRERLGYVFSPETSYQCFPSAMNRVRRPDVSFIRRGRFADEVLPEGHCRIPPDLAIEVISPNDLAYEVAEKVREYLDADVRLVWVVIPRSKEVHIHRPRGSAAGVLTGLGEDDLITGEDVIPGFSCSVSEFFDR